MRFSLCAALAAALAGAASAQRLDTTNFVVLGEGLAAGQGYYALSDQIQNSSFGALMAKQMGTIFPQPVIQGPGIGDVLGYPQLPARLPAYPQGSVRQFIKTGPNKGDESPSLFVFNVSVPNHSVLSALNSRPLYPLIHQNNTQQSMINLLIAFPQMLFEDAVPLWSQVEYAEAMNPTLAVVELGYFEALDATVNADPLRIPDPAAFRTNYSAILKRLRAKFAEVVVMSIPDPIDTAYCTQTLAAAAFLNVNPLILLNENGYGMAVNDYMTRIGIEAAGAQIFARRLAPLPPGSILRAAVAAQIRARVRALNTEIQNMAREQGAQFYDLNALFARVKSPGVTVGSTRLTADYMGGFFTLDGFYPGKTGHALIANDMLGLLNRTYGKSYALVDVAAVASNDATAQVRRPPVGAQVLNPADLGAPEIQEVQ